MYRISKQGQLVTAHIFSDVCMFGGLELDKKGASRNSDFYKNLLAVRNPMVDG